MSSRLTRPAEPSTSALPTDFHTAARAVVAFLRERLGFELWMVSRIHDDDWIVLAADSTEADVSPGDVFRFPDSFCIRMIADQGPRVAPDSSAVPSYRQA